MSADTVARAPEGRTSKFLWSVGLTALNQAVVLVTGLWLTRYLLGEVGAGALGWWAQATVMVGYLGLVDFGVMSLLPREVATAVGRRNSESAPTELPGVVARYFKFAIYQTPLAAAVAVGGILVLARLDSETAALCVGLFAVAVVTFPLRVASGVLTGLQDVRYVGGIQILVYLSGVAVTVGGVRAGLGLSALALGWATQTVGGIAVAWWRLRAKHRDVLPSIGEVAASRIPRRMVIDGGWAWMATIGVGLHATAEVLVLGWFEPLPVVFQYACSTKLPAICAPLVLIFCQSALPGMAELRASGDIASIRRATAAYMQLVLAASGFCGVVVLSVNGWFVARWVGDGQYLSDTTTVLSVLGVNARHAVNALAVMLFCVSRERALWRVTLLDGLLSVVATAAVVWFAGPTLTPAGPLVVAVVFTGPALLLVTRADGTLSLGELLRAPLRWSLAYLALAVGTVALASDSVGRDTIPQLACSAALAVVYLASQLWLLRGTPLAAYLPRFGRR